ncbi:glycosyltransferase family 87 protein [Actinoplanes sp. NPDC051861]|uniref:glycosyltransferase family 87 protein n=1 Tax=Actinoplanes sp. NPDC051861 TaxID=3155170 RepID=UPI00343D62ED
MPEIDKSALRAALLGFATIGVVGFSLQRYELSTLAIELEAIRGWLGGDSLYAYRMPGTQAGAALSPALALLLAPLTLLPLRLAGWLLALAGVTALLLALVVLAGPVARRYGHRRTTVVLALSALAMLTTPVHAAIGLGRTDLLLFGLVVADLIALRRAARARSRATWWPAPSHPTNRLRRFWSGGGWAGIGTGLATALSAAPVLFIVYLLITRQRRAASTALATATAVTLSALLLAPDETLTWFGATLWELDRAAPISDPGNQSLAGLLARLYGYPAPPILVWLPFAVLLLAVGLIRARSAHTDGDEIAAFTLIALTAAAAGPVTAPAETIWLLPAVLILADTAVRRRRDVRVPRVLRHTGAGMGVAALLGFVLLVAGPSVSQPWNGVAFVLILLVNALPWRHGCAPAIPIPRPLRRPVAIPVPREG